MTTIYDIKKRAQQLSEKTDSETISPQEVGGLFSDLADYANDVDVNGSSLGIRKTYTSVSAMEADKNPVGDDGKPLKKGQLVNIYNQDDPSSADNNKVFSWQNPGWQIRTTLDAGYATREELTELEYDKSFSPTIYIGKNKLIDGDNGYNAINEQYAIILITVQPNSNYVIHNYPAIIKSKIVYYDKRPTFSGNSDNYIQSSSINNSYATKITTPENCTYVGICFSINSLDKLKNIKISYTDNSIYALHTGLEYLAIENIFPELSIGGFTLYNALKAMGTIGIFSKKITFINAYTKRREYWFTNENELSYNLSNWYNNNKINIYTGYVQLKNVISGSDGFGSISAYDIFIAKVNPNYIYELSDLDLVNNEISLYSDMPNIEVSDNGQPNYINSVKLLNNRKIILPKNCRYTVGCIRDDTHTVLYNELKLNPIDVLRVITIGNYGQSNAIGNSAFPIISNTGDSNSILMLGESIHNVIDGDIFLPLKEGKTDTSYCGESCITSMLSNLIQLDKIYIGFTSGVGGQPISVFVKGTEAYNNFINYFKNLKNKVNNVSVDCINWIQGESNSFPSPITEDEYESNLKILLSDINNDVKSVTQQNNDILFLSYQSAWGNWRSYINSNLYARIPLVFYRLHKWLKNFKIVSPCYNLPYLSENNNYIHLSAEGQFLFGQYAARAYRRLKSGNNNICCEPMQFIRDESTLKIKVKTPCPPLVIDTTIYPKVGDSYGFTGFDEEGAFIGITDVKVDYDTIIITSEKPLYRIVYGFGATIDIVTIDNNTGYNKNRGNIRDSQGNDDYVNINSKKYSLHNWLLMFNEVVE